MIKVKISALLLSILLIAGCSDEGDRIPGKCGVSESNPNLVVGYNNEICRENVSARFNSTLMKGAGQTAIPKTDEGSRFVQEDINDEPAHIKLQEQANVTTGIARFGITTAIWLLGVFILIWNAIRILKSKAVQEKDHYDSTKPRYSGMSYVIPFVGIFFLLPYYFEGSEDGDSYSVIATRYATIKIMWGDVLEAGFASAILAKEQKGDLGEVTNETTKKFDTSYANARSIAFAQVNAQLLDNVTAKSYYKLHNLTLPAGQRQVEFQEPFTFFFNDNDVSVRRLEVGSMRQDKTISEVANMNIKEKYTLNPSVKDEAASLRKSYLTTDSASQESSLAGFKAAVMAALGVDKSSPDINNAVVSQSNEIMRAILIEQMNSQSLIKKTARLQEELMCIRDFQIAGETYVQDIKNYVRFLNNEIPEPRFAAAIECVGGKTGAYNVYGERSEATVLNELDTAFKELTEVNYKILSNQTKALANVTIDESNGTACVKARKGGTTDFARYYPLCVKQATANKQIINIATTNFSITGNGAGAYLDTNFALKDNDQLDTLRLRNFDAQMTAMYNSIDVQVDFTRTDKDAYLETLIRANLGDQSSLKASVMDLITGPTTSFKRDLGWTEECQGGLYHCIKAENVVPALSNMSEKMIDTGVFIVTFSLTASTLASKFQKSDDKSMSYSSEPKKKHNAKAKSKAKTSKGKSESTSMLNGVLKVVEFMFSMFTSLAYWMIYLGWLLSYMLAVIPLFFVIAGLLVLIFLMYSVLLSAFRFMWMLWPNDRNNISMNLKKMMNEFVYDVSIKAVLVIVQVMFYKVLGFALKLLVFLMLNYMEQGTTEAIVGGLFLGPMLYFVVVGLLTGTIKILDAYAEKLGANALLAEIMSESLELCLIVITFGLPLLFIKINKMRRKR